MTILSHSSLTICLTKTIHPKQSNLLMTSQESEWLEEKLPQLQQTNSSL